MGYDGLRGWLEEVARLGELKEIRGAHWDRELGGLVDMIYRELPVAPAVLFDEIEGYPEGYRVLFGELGSVRRLALTLGVPLRSERILDFIDDYRHRLLDMRSVPPVEVADGPVAEHVDEGPAVDLFKFPAPFHHELDGGRYFGTAHVVLTRDPEGGWVNGGTYRLQLHDRNVLGFYSTPGKHGAIHAQKYFSRGEPCPVAVAIGTDPLLWFASTMEVPTGVSEYEYAGGIRGEPLPVLRGPVTGLPVPADAEIVLEGEVDPVERRQEGPFGEWPGYYAGHSRLEPIMRVKRVLYRSRPIFTSANPARPPDDQGFHRGIVRSSMIWNALEMNGITDVRGVWCHPSGGGRMLTIVSLKQRYAGHAKQAALIASQCRAGAYLNRFTLVVDEDIDPTNTNDVLWALCSRTDPEKDIDIIRQAWASKADPLIPPGSTTYYNSRAAVLACKPFEWLERFPAVAEASPALRERLLDRFGRSIYDPSVVSHPKVASPAG
ncbi:MAG: UbiD family decarboxylase [Chloroflexi bacterium]|nr:UbiD family decarboxylase [Chloroflexota bacterium]